MDRCHDGYRWPVHRPHTILDTGCRIEELLTANVRAFDFDNLLVTIYGKGRKGAAGADVGATTAGAVPVRAGEGARG